MVFVVERNIFNSTNQFSETAQQSPQKEVASATSSDVMGTFVIPAQAGNSNIFLKVPVFTGMTEWGSKTKKGVTT